MKISVAGMGYVGLSLAVLLAQKNKVTVVDVVPEKVEKLNSGISPIQDEAIERYLSEDKLSYEKTGVHTLDLTATTDADFSYKTAEFVIIAVPTNYDSEQNYFDTSAIEAVIERVQAVNDKAILVIKSTVPVGYTESVRKRYKNNKILFSPEFLRESKALYDNLYPSRIIVHLKPRNIKGELIIGFEDPSVTGQFLAVSSLFYPFLGEQVKLHPDFENEVLEGAIQIRGHIRAIHALRIVWHIFRNNNIMQIIKKFQNKH